MLIYPAIFHKVVEGGYIVVFPDFNDGATEGQSPAENSTNIASRAT